MKGSRKTEIVIISVCLACVLVGAVIAAFFTPQKQPLDAGQVSNICTMICDEMEKLEENTRKTDGYVNVNNLPALLDEMEQQAAQFAECGVITQYAREDACIRMELEGGIEYYYFPVMDDMMSTGAQADPSLTVNEMDARTSGGWRAESGDPKEILTIEPFATDPNFVLHYTFGGRSPDKAAAAIAEAIPDEYAFPDANNLDSFAPEQVTAMEGKSVIVWYGHGGMTEKYGPTLESSVKQTRENLEKYASFINGSGQNSQMIISNRNLSYTHYFFDQNLADRSLEGSLVYLAACHSAESDALGQAFIDKGADLVIGHTNSVRTRYNLYMLSDFLQYLKTQKEDGSYPTVEEALAYAKEENGERDSISFGYGASVVLGYAPGKSEYRLAYSDPAEESAESDSDQWKQSYIDYIDARRVQDPSDNVIYKLVDIDGNEIPELYINFGSTAGGDVICSFYDGNVIEQTMWNFGFSYIEGQNIFRDLGGHMDYYYDKIYAIQNGEFVLLGQGEYGALNNAQVEFDSEGRPIYRYYWNGEEVASETEYMQLVNDLYDAERAVTPFDGAEYSGEAGRYVGNGLCNYEEIVQSINAYE